MKTARVVLLILVLLLISACGAPASQAEPPQQQALLVVAVTITPILPTAQASSTIAPSRTLMPSPTASPSASPSQGALQALVVTAHSSAPQTSAQAPLARVITSAPVENPPVAEPQTSFKRQTIKTDDGFVAVRAEPTSKSPELLRLSAYTTVSCSHYVAGEYIFGSNQWAFCPSVGGYILSVLLE